MGVGFGGGWRTGSPTAASTHDEASRAEFAKQVARVLRTRGGWAWRGLGLDAYCRSRQQGTGCVGGEGRPAHRTRGFDGTRSTESSELAKVDRVLRLRGGEARGAGAGRLLQEQALVAAWGRGRWM